MRIGAAVIAFCFAVVLARAGHARSSTPCPGRPDLPGVLALVDGERLELDAVTERVAEATERERFDRLYHLGRYHFALFAQTLNERERWIDERVLARAALAGGTPVDELVEKKLEVMAARGVRADRQAVVLELREASAERLVVPPFRLPVDTSGQPFAGSPSATIEVVSFIDFYCGGCKTLESELRSLLENYPGRVRLVALHFPLSPSDGPNFRLVEAAYCAAAQRKYWEFRLSLLESLEATAEPTEAAFRAGAHAGLDNVELKSCLESRRYVARVRAEQEQAALLGVFGTPVVLVNGRRVPGADRPGTIRSLVDLELEAAPRSSAR